MKTRFEWDPDKAASNRAKHGVSFDTASRAFADPFLLMVQDRIENGERRWRSLGRVEGQLLLLIAHTVGEDEDGCECIRLISAPKAEARERKRYEEDSDLRA